MEPNIAQRAQDIRDLQNQITELRGTSAIQEVAIHAKRISTVADHAVPLWSMVDGEEIVIPHFRLRETLDQRLLAGGYAFTAKKEEAPEYKIGQVKCFLHPESPERGILAEIGMGGKFCRARHLSSTYSKRMHGLHRHKEEFRALQEHITEQKETEREKRQERQLEATLDIARAAGSTSTEEVPERKQRRTPEEVAAAKARYGRPGPTQGE